MIEIPPYLKLVVNQGQRRSTQTVRAATGSDEAARRQPGDVNTNSLLETPASAVILSLGETRRCGQGGGAEPPPTPEEAAFALSQLQRDLPTLGQGVHDLHDNLDRSRVLDLLAPLVDD